MPPRLHIQFAAGALEGPLSVRAGAHAAQPAHVAARDLERYYQLLTDELARVRLSETEALTLVAACRGWLVEPASYRYLWAEVEDYLADQVEDTGVAALDVIPRLPASERAVLVAKLRALSPGAVLAVCDAVERYWLMVREAQEDVVYRAELGIPPEPDQWPSAMLRAVGLVLND